jgi:hypothetical protein
MTAAPQTTTSEETSNVVRLIAETPLLKAALAEQNAATTLARRGLIAQVKSLERAHEKALTKLEAELAAALALVKQAETALLAAQKRANAALGAKSVQSYSYSAQRGRLEQQLRETAPMVAPFVREMHIEMDATRKRFSYLETRALINEVTREVRRVVVNNSISVAARVSALFRAVDDAERLALEVDDPSTIGQLLGEIGAALPLVEDPRIA